MICLIFLTMIFDSLKRSFFQLCYYRPPPQRLAHVWPRLFDTPFAEGLATLLLQQRGNKRIGAEPALMHRYFADLPQKLHELDDGMCILKTVSMINTVIICEISLKSLT